MPIRNPFARRPGAVAVQDENSRPGSTAGEIDVPHLGFERVDTVGSKASSALSIRSRRSQDTGEYKMSVEKEATWPKRYVSRASSDAKSHSGEIEHFSISRESFDSYRRSFDICAKSPVSITESAPRGSLDSSRFARFPRSHPGERRFGQEPPTPEESFEDVGLNDDKQQPLQPQHANKLRFFSKFGSNATTPDGNAAHSQSMTRFLPGRKRGHSGQGSELGAIMSSAMDRPPTATSLQEQEVQS
ncbi:hypothetical protein OQA88_5704 [Cercophora sp. LCS_1]